MRTSKEALRRCVRYFNEVDEETIVQAIPNARAEAWLMEHIPRVLLPDPILEQTYYFRWWTYRKHIKQTADGWVITEFHPEVPWAGKHNTIIASGCHHIDEGRWLRRTSLLDEYLYFFYRKGGDLHSYSNWFEHSVLGLCEVRGDATMGIDLIDDMKDSYADWERSNANPSGLFWSNDDRDASEFSISGNGLRPTLNCYQYANARAIAAFARAMGDEESARSYDDKAGALREKINSLLWDERAMFYKVIPLPSKGDHYGGESIDPRRDAREIWGYLPWLFGVAPAGRAEAFEQLLDVNGFRAAHGLTTAERRHPGFGLFYTGDELNRWRIERGEEAVGPKGHECLWNGPSWPFSTCMTLGALSNLLDSGEAQASISAADYLMLLSQYARAHIRKLEDGSFIPWIDENLHPDTGDWISRTRLMGWDENGWSREKGGYERGKDYNHSTFANIVIGGLFGVRPALKGVRVAPLFPASWPYAYLEDVCVHGRMLHIRYNNPRLGGEGYQIFADGERLFASREPVECAIDF